MMLSDVNADVDRVALLGQAPAGTRRHHCGNVRVQELQKQKKMEGASLNAFTSYLGYLELPRRHNNDERLLPKVQNTHPRLRHQVSSNVGRLNRRKMAGTTC